MYAMFEGCSLHSSWETCDTNLLIYKWTNKENIKVMSPILPPIIQHTFPIYTLSFKILT